MVVCLLQVEAGTMIPTFFNSKTGILTLPVPMILQWTCMPIKNCRDHQFQEASCVKKQDESLQLANSAEYIVGVFADGIGYLIQE